MAKYQFFTMTIVLLSYVSAGAEPQSEAQQSAEQIQGTATNNQAAATVTVPPGNLAVKQQTTNPSSPSQSNDTPRITPPVSSAQGQSAQQSTQATPATLPVVQQSNVLPTQLSTVTPPVKSANQTSQQAEQKGQEVHQAQNVSADTHSKDNGKRKSSEEEDRSKKKNVIKEDKQAQHIVEKEIPAQQSQPVPQEQTSVPSKVTVSTPVNAIVPPNQPNTSDTQGAPKIHGDAQEEIPEIVGIDTVNVEAASGNWLLKRIWFERAQEKYEEIKGAFDKVLELRMTFFAKRSELERKLFDPFYINVGIGQGELLEIVGRLLEDLEHVRENEGALNEQELLLFEALKKERETVEVLRKDITAITDIDTALEAAINQLVDQVNVSRSYEKRAWETFKEIGKQLSDKKARELFYVMDMYRKNSAEIIAYLQNDFTRYMETLEITAHQQIDRIIKTVNELKQKDIDFKKQAQRIEEKRHAKPLVEVAEQQKELEPQGMVQRVWGTIKSGVLTSWQIVSNGSKALYRWFWPYADSENESEDIIPLVKPTAQPKIKSQQKALQNSAGV